MSLPIGTLAPDFTLPSTSGRDFNLRLDGLGQPLVLYFYPKDFTRTCTAEACGFRDEFAHFAELGVPVYGISRDTLETHRKFKRAYNLPFDLLADPTARVIQQYTGKLPIVGWSKRVTYLLDGDQRVAAVYDKLFQGREHIDHTLRALNRLTRP